MSRVSKKQRWQMTAVICRLFGWIILIVVGAALLSVTLPRAFGYEIYNVLSDSMEPEIPVGSAAYVKPVDPLTIEEGAIIAFTSEGDVVFQRVVNNRKVEFYLDTQGIKDDEAGKAKEEEEETTAVEYANVRGLLVRHIALLGQFMMILSNALGKVLVICLALCGVLLNVIAGRIGKNKS